MYVAAAAAQATCIGEEGVAAPWLKVGLEGGDILGEGAGSYVAAAAAGQMLWG